MRIFIYFAIIINFALSERNFDIIQADSVNRDNECICDEGYIEDCEGDGDCCPETWLGDDVCDDGSPWADYDYSCDLRCYANDNLDCGSVPGNNMDGSFAANYYYCEPGTVPDCAVDGDCCDATWIDDNVCDDENQARGCDLQCYYEDGFDCEYGWPGSWTAQLTVDCEWCETFYEVSDGNPFFDCWDLLITGADPVGGGSQYNCYVCEEVYDCHGTCMGSGPQPSVSCCDGSLACHDCDCEVYYDECGLCAGDSNGPNTGIQDCAGICYGDTVEDCAGECGGNAVIDECGICGGTGFPEGACDCFGNDYDSCGVCGGDDLADAGCGCFEPPPNNCGACDGDGTDCNNDGINDECEVEYDLGALSGDANGDGMLNILDIVLYVEIILGN